MKTACVQCALEAFVTTDDAAELRRLSVFDETPEQHRERVHPDPQVTHTRRRELEKLFAQKMGGQMVYPDDN
jgi:hypothetical protein